MDSVALQFALRLCTDERYATNPALNKSRAEYIAEDAVELSQALFKKLYPNHVTIEVDAANGLASPNVISVKFSEA